MRILIAEDEQRTRQGLVRVLQSLRDEYEIVAQASNGKAALEMILEQKPDVVFIDIKMPFMDGLSLSRIVREEFPKTKILIISGYDDFEYAREAISIGVDQYILKPVTRMSLRKVLQELKEKIEAEQEQEDFQSKLANEMHEYEQFSIRHFFEQVLEGELCVTEIYDEAAKWSLDLSASCYNLLFLYVQQEKENGSEREMNTFVHLQEEILQYFLRFPQYILFRWNVNCYGVLVKCDAEEMEDYTQRAIAQIQMNCESQNANADWYVVVGTPVERLSMLKECYDRVNHYGAYRFLYPQMHVLSEETLKSYLPAQDDTRIAEVDATKMSPEIISEFLAKGSSKEVYNFVESYLQSISEVIHSVIFRDYVVLNIRFTAIAFMERNGVTKEEFLDMVAIAESTPGPMAVNSATYIGYKLEGVPGAAASTLAVCLPSFAVIYAISLFFDQFLQLSVVSSAFRGIQVCVVYLVLSAGLKMLKNLKKDAFSRAVLAAVLLAMVSCSVLAVSFSSIFYILLSGAAGLAVYGVQQLRKEAGAK